MRHDKIAVVDFGGQYAHLIATKIRRLQVLAEIRQPEDPTELFEQYKGIVLSGSPSLSAFGEDSVYNKSIYDLEVPILGFCFGHQEIAKHYGGEVVHGGREWGAADLHVIRDHALFSGLSRKEPVWMSHFDSVVAVGPDFEELGFTTLGANARSGHRYAAIGSDRHRRYGFQFHPEVDDTLRGGEMLANFVFGICGCTPSWSMERYVDELCERLRAQIGDRSVFLLASGGVDSTVAAKLLGQAIGGDRLHLLHIDNGLMRKDESRQVMETFAVLRLDTHLTFVDASDAFLRALEGEIEPERKRRIIGDTFIEVFEREARRAGATSHLLAQGTIYPDTIETGGTKRADTIKTHHNRVPIVQEMLAAGRVIEPLVDLYKVEVRELGRQLGVPDDLIWRHPFPGPGLGVRLLCSDGREDRAHLDEAEPPLAELSRRFGICAQALPIKSVGVKADLRSYEHPVLLSGACEWNRLQEFAGEIYRAVPHINRAIWWSGGGPPSEVRPIAATITRERLDLLRDADAIVMDALRRHGIYRDVWQCPTVLVPASCDSRGRELAIVRPIRSERGMTAQAAELPRAVIDEITPALLALDGISGVAIDLTSKPPGTIEWE